MCIFILFFLLVTWLLNIWTISSKNINHDRVWVLGLGECDSRIERLQHLQGWGNQLQSLLQPETVKAVTSFREICVEWVHDLPSARNMPEKRTFLGRNSSQLLAWAEKIGVGVCNYLLVEVYVPSAAACVVPRPGSVSSQKQWEGLDPGDFWLLIFAVIKESRTLGISGCWGVERLGLWTGTDLRRSFKHGLVGEVGFDVT